MLISPAGISDSDSNIQLFERFYVRPKRECFLKFILDKAMAVLDYMRSFFDSSLTSAKVLLSNQRNKLRQCLIIFRLLNKRINFTKLPNSISILIHTVRVYRLMKYKFSNKI